MRALVCTLWLVGCGPGDPCDPFPGQTCFSLEVRGPGLTVDQIGVHAVAGFPLDDGRSPSAAGDAFGLPVRVAVLPPGGFAGAAELEVRGFIGGVIAGLDNVHATVAAGQHLGIIAELGNHPFDLAGVDFSGKPDLAQPVDLAAPPGADLSGVSDFVVESSVVTDVEFTAVWGTSSSNVYILSLLGDVLHSSGNGTWIVQHSRAANETYTVLWGSAADDIWAGGGLFPCGGTTGGPATCTPRLLHSTGGGTWTASTPPGSDANFGVNIQAIGGTGADDLYFSVSGTAANQGVLHSTTDGASFEALQSFGSMAPPTDLFAASATAIYGPRSVGDVLFSSGNGSWAAQTGVASGDTTDFIFGVSASSLYAAGTNFNSNQSDIYHSTGNGTWTRETSTASFGFAQSMTGSSTSDLYASYECGLLHSTGDGNWTPVALPVTGCPLRRAWAAPDGQLFIVGKKGLILHKR